MKSFVFAIFYFISIVFAQNDAMDAMKRSMSKTEEELLQHIKETNEKLLNVMKENKDSIKSLKDEVTQKLKEEADKSKKREDELNEQIVAMEKKFDHKLDVVKADMKNNGQSSSSSNSQTPSNNAQNSNPTVPADFQTAVNLRLNRHSKFLVHNDVAIHRLTAVAQQLKDAVMHPTLHQGCPLGWVKVQGSCIHIGPKATFHENKKYCELFNAKMVTTESKYGEIIASRLAKYSPEIGVWMQSRLPKNEHYVDDGYKNDLIDSLNDLKCTAFIPLNGKWVTGNCNKQFNTLCQITIDDKQHEIKDFADSADKFLAI